MICVRLSLIAVLVFLAAGVERGAAAPIAVRTLPIEADALDACADGVGNLHVAYLHHGRAFHVQQPAGGALGKPVPLPCPVGSGGHGGSIQIVSAGARLLVMAPAHGGFCLAASDDGGGTWQTRTSLDVTGHEAIESGRIAASGTSVHVAWVNEEAAKDEHDKVASPLFYATSPDGGRTFSKARAVTEGFPRACPCCPASLVVSGDTVRIAYRTSVKNVKEVGLLTSRDGGKTFASRQVSDDRWEMMGCPANGPGLGIAGDRVTLTWTRENTILSASSTDGGGSFSKPAVVGAGRLHRAAGGEEGTVAVVETATGATVSRGAGPPESLGGNLPRASALVDLPGEGTVLVRSK